MPCSSARVQPRRSPFAPILAALGRRVVVIAIYEEPAAFNPGVLLRGAEMVGSLGYAPGVFGRVIDAMAAGAYPTDGWVDHIPLDDLVTDGLEALPRRAPHEGAGRPTRKVAPHAPAEKNVCGESGTWWLPRSGSAGPAAHLPQ